VGSLQTLVATFTTRGATSPRPSSRRGRTCTRWCSAKALLLSFIRQLLVARLDSSPPSIPFVLFLGRRPRLAESPADVERHAAIVES